MTQFKAGPCLPDSQTPQAAFLSRAHENLCAWARCCQVHLLVLCVSAEEDEVLRGNGLLRTGKSPLPVKNFGIWLRYDLITAGTRPSAHGAPCPGPLNPDHEGGGGRSQQVPDTSSSTAAGIKFLLPHPSATQARLHPQEANLLLGTALLCP